MTINYFIIGGAIVLVIGVGTYYLVQRNKKGVGGETLSPDKITLKSVETISLKDIGPWLKTTRVDIEDFGINTRLYAVKNFQSQASGVNLPKDIMSKLGDTSKKKMIAFVLTDMDFNTKHVLIVIGESIDSSLENSLKQDITELNIK